MSSGLSSWSLESRLRSWCLLLKVSYLCTLPVPSLDFLRGSSAGAGPMASVRDEGYHPVPCKGHKQSVYALAINEAGTLLVSGSTENVSALACKPPSGKQQRVTRMLQSEDSN
jgi:hypothetical protein